MTTLSEQQEFWIERLIRSNWGFSESKKEHVSLMSEDLIKGFSVCDEKHSAKKHIASYVSLKMIHELFMEISLHIPSFEMEFSLDRVQPVIIDLIKGKPIKIGLFVPEIGNEKAHILDELFFFMAPILIE